PSIDWNEVFVNAAVGGATAGGSFGAASAAPALRRIAARLGSRDAAVVPEERVATTGGKGANHGLGELVSLPNTDPATTALAERIGGLPSVRFTHGPPNEFDAVSDKYVAQAKPANFTLNQRFRQQAKMTFETAIQTGRIPYFQFDGPPGPGVLNALRRYAARYGVEPVIDIEPFGG
ncbi:MAG: hypothetical protein M3256_27170, partial [Actinomycetota bacterium]|nr:hypothetical protein [Actinomycetota bacterium]